MPFSLQKFSILDQSSKSGDIETSFFGLARRNEMVEFPEPVSIILQSRID